MDMLIKLLLIMRFCLDYRVFIDLTFTYILRFLEIKSYFYLELSYRLKRDFRDLLIIAVCSAREDLFIIQKRS